MKKILLFVLFSMSVIGCKDKNNSGIIEPEIVEPKEISKNISTENYEISSDGLTLIKWKNKNTKDLDMNADPNLIKVKIIGEQAFLECSNLNSIKFSESITTIGGYAFSKCTNLRDVELSNKITDIKNNAFMRCNSIKSIKIPNSVKKIGNYAFSDCSNLTEIELPKTLSVLGRGAFESCNSLASIEIPSSLGIIDYYTFSYCSSLSSIDIPSSIDFIGERAFMGCSSLSSITLRSTTSIGYKREMLSGTAKSMNIYVPADLVDEYKQMNGWYDFAGKIKAINL